MIIPQKACYGLFLHLLDNSSEASDSIIVDNRIRTCLGRLALAAADPHELFGDSLPVGTAEGHGPGLGATRTATLVPLAGRAELGLVGVNTGALAVLQVDGEVTVTPRAATVVFRFDHVLSDQVSTAK